MGWKGPMTGRGGRRAMTGWGGVRGVLRVRARVGIREHLYHFIPVMV